MNRRGDLAKQVNAGRGEDSRIHSALVLDEAKELLTETSGSTVQGLLNMGWDFGVHSIIVGQSLGMFDVVGGSSALLYVLKNISCHFYRRDRCPSSNRGAADR